MPFKMFSPSDFTPVGCVVAIAGILYISLFAWWLLPLRKGQGSVEALFHIKDYTTEVRITKNSAIAGSTIADWHDTKTLKSTSSALPVKHNIVYPSPNELLQEGDVLVIESDSKDLKTFIDSAKLELAGDKALEKDILGSQDMLMVEGVVRVDSEFIGQTAYSLNRPFGRFGLNLLAVARKGSRLTQRLVTISFQLGDVVLVSGLADSIHETIADLGCIPLAQRSLRIGQPRQIIKSGAVFWRYPCG